MTLYAVLTRSAVAFPAKPAIYFREHTIGYAQLAGLVNRTIHALKSDGIRAGKSVALLLPNCPQFVVSYYSSTALGAMCVPVNPLLKAHELSYIWGDCKADIIITIAPCLQNALDALEMMGNNIPILIVGEPVEGQRNFDSWISEFPTTPPTLDSVDPDSPAVCIYTSGTTGRPKGALLSHNNLIINCEQVRQALHLDERDNFLCVLPLFHSFAGTVCQNTPIHAGATITILEQFQPNRVLEAVAKYQTTVFAGVPAMFGALLQYGSTTPHDFSSVRISVSGGAPMPVALMSQFEATFNTTIIEGDGPTECSPVTSVNPVDGIRKPGTVGLPIPGCEVKIFDDNDNELATEEIGEIVVRGKNVMLGYLNQPEETAKAMTSGWYHTGDIGKIDADGYISILDRKKDMLLVGGFNVYPREIEEVLYAHPAVKDAAVIGAPDKMRGEEVVAVISLKPDATATNREIISYCREQLANYKVPRRVIFRDELPRGGTGKILKRLLRKELDMEGNGE
ncbi:MAG: long-chain fatty acid--CoA ligase [Chthonomonadales bacterium]